MSNYLVTDPGPICTGPPSGTVKLAWMVYNVNSLVLSDSNQVPLQCDVNGNLKVNVVVGGGGGGGGTVNQGNQGTIPQSWFVELTNGTNVIGVAGAPLRIDPTGTTTQPTQDAADGTIGNPAGTTVIGLGAQDTGTGDVTALTTTNGLLNTSASVDSTYAGSGSATWTSATALNTALTATSLATSSVISIIPTGSITGGVVTFEQTADGSNWSPLPVVNPTTGQIVYTYALSTTGNVAFQIATNSNAIRVRLSTQIAGSGSIGVAFVAFSVGAQTIVAVSNLPASSSTTLSGPVSGQLGNTATNVFAVILDTLQQLLVEARLTRQILAIAMSESGQSKVDDFEPTVNPALDTDGSFGNWA